MYCEICKKDYKNKAHLKTKKHLVNGGFIDFKQIGNSLKRFDFNNESKEVLKKFGHKKIMSFLIARKPIMTVLNKALDLITFNKFSDLKKKYSFDELFHLCLIVVLEDNSRIFVEKVDAVRISRKDDITSEKTEYLAVPFNQNLTFKEFIDNSRKHVNNDELYFDYNFQNNNCQVFLSYLLQSAGVYGKKEKDFIFQDISELAKELPDYSKKIINTITDLGQISNKILGKGFWEEEEERKKALFKKDYEKNKPFLDKRKREKNKQKEYFESLFKLLEDNKQLGFNRETFSGDIWEFLKQNMEKTGYYPEYNEKNNRWTWVVYKKPKLSMDTVDMGIAGKLIKTVGLDKLANKFMDIGNKAADGDIVGVLKTTGEIGKEGYDIYKNPEAFVKNTAKTTAKNIAKEAVGSGKKTVKISKNSRDLLLLI